MLQACDSWNGHSHVREQFRFSCAAFGSLGVSLVTTEVNCGLCGCSSAIFCSMSREKSKSGTEVEQLDPSPLLYSGAKTFPFLSMFTTGVFFSFLFYILCALLQSVSAQWDRFSLQGEAVWAGQSFKSFWSVSSKIAKYFKIQPKIKLLFSLHFRFLHNIMRKKYKIKRLKQVLMYVWSKSLLYALLPFFRNIDFAK